MQKEVAAFEAEGRHLQALVATLPDSEWERPTPFKQWTVWDVIAHLHLSDQWALAAIDGRPRFSAAVLPLLAAIKSGGTLRDYTRAHFRAKPREAILESWCACFAVLLEKARALDERSRLAWFGPDMGARTFITARYMETWAHGQDVHDLLGLERQYTDDIQAIAALGIKTFGYAFANRGMPIPDTAPYVRLTAPSGAIWEWNALSEFDRIEGRASDFCHVVTQGRNIADTELAVTGPVAGQWMAIAQCFAGPPEEPPAPGTRTSTRAPGTEG